MLQTWWYFFEPLQVIPSETGEGDRYVLFQPTKKSKPSRYGKAPEDMTLREYIQSGEIDNPANIDGIYDNVDDFLASLPKNDY